MVLNAEVMSRNDIHTSIHSPLQVIKAEMESGGDNVLSGVIWPVGKLEEVESGWEYGGNELLYQPLKALHYDGSECDRPIIIE